MAIVKMQTAPANSSSEGGSNLIWWILGLGAAAFLGYQFVYKPYAEKKKAEEAKAKIDGE